MLSTSTHPLPAFERVYREQFEFVWRTVRALGVSDAALDDAVQDVFVVVHRRLPEFEGRASVRTWTYEIAKRVALRHRSVAARDAARYGELPELPARDDLDDAIDRARASVVMREFLWSLDEDRRRAFILSEFGEMPGREIAAMLDVNMNTIYARIRSARTELDRIAKRLHAQDAGAIRRAMRRQRPDHEAAPRTLASVLAVVAPSSSGPLGVGVAMTGLGWLVGGLITAGVALAAFGGDAEPEAMPEAVPALGPQNATDSFAPPPSPTPATVLPVEDPPAKPSSSQPTAPRSRGKTRTDSPSLTEELRLVREIRGAVHKGAAEVATAAISTYRKEHTHGTLRMEVDALEVELACRTHAADTSSRLDAFRETHPDAALLSRLEIVCKERIAPQKPGSAGTQSQ